MPNYNTLNRWLEAKKGKFEIRDWQTLAKIWYLEKERTSEEMDATSIFKKVGIQFTHVHISYSCQAAVMAM